MARKLLAAAVLVLPSCQAAQTYDYGGREAYHYAEEPESTTDWFGYATVGWQVYADYGGDLDLGSGTGWRVSLPPLGVLWIGVLGLGLSQGGDISGADDPFLFDTAIWTSGLSDSRRLLSEVSWELTFEGSDHGSDDALRLLTGLKVGTNRKWRARPYACGGWSWHWISREEEDDLSANGPYAGGGLDLFLSRRSSVGLDGRWHWVFAEDYGATGLLTVELSLSGHW